jgi:hypothetical protein
MLEWYWEQVTSQEVMVWNDRTDESRFLAVIKLEVFTTVKI